MRVNYVGATLAVAQSNRDLSTRFLRFFGNVIRQRGKENAEQAHRQKCGEQGRRAGCGEKFVESGCV